VQLAAAYSAAVTFEESPQRCLSEYLRLPAAQFALLDAARVQRSEGGAAGVSEFHCTLRSMRALSMLVEPVLTVQLNPHGEFSRQSPSDAGSVSDSDTRVPDATPLSTAVYKS
jgi:hypothetical protein